MANRYTVDLSQVGLKDLSIVGGKNASLGEMIQTLSSKGVKVPGGFATTAQAFIEFIEENELNDYIQEQLTNIDINDLSALATAGKNIRQRISNASFNKNFEDAIRSSYQNLENKFETKITVAVRSSGTAEDLPDASFAGQHESYLNISGIDNLILTIKKVFASLFNDRAITYRYHNNFDPINITISVGIQQMVRSDLANSGVMFTLDTESGFDNAIFITAVHGLGESIVQGQVNPDEFYVFKPTLKQNLPAIISRSSGCKKTKMVYEENGGVKTIAVNVKEQNKFCITDKEIEELAKIGLIIEEKYNCPMDIEWAKDGITGDIYIVQARPETVISQNKQTIERYTLKETSNVIISGRSVGQKIGSGKVNIIDDIADAENLKAGDILVTDMTDPDWETVMQRAGAIITNRGGRTCHAAIIARELGVPAVVGCGNATTKLTQDQMVTVSCAEGGTGYVYEGELPFEINIIHLESMPKAPCQIMANVGNPFRAFSFSQLPNNGVGLARLEFIINKMVGIHPNALVELETLSEDVQLKIKAAMSPYTDPIEFYVDRLREGIATIAAAFYPKPVIVRLSDFKSNEYSSMLGGHIYEAKEENPMIGFRGVSRFTSKSFARPFELECQALKLVREEMGLTNVKIMVPFVRTTEEAEQIISLLAKNGLERGKYNLEIIMMCEVPSNAILADSFLNYFDGFSIGSNDLTQMTLGLDRDSELIADKFDERNEAVKALIQNAIQACRKKNKYIGICGQGPSDFPDFAKWLVEAGIDSMSLNPDSILDTWLQLETKK